MTVEQALQFLLNLAGEAPVSKKVHIQAEEAFKVIKQALEEKDKK